MHEWLRKVAKVILILVGRKKDERTPPDVGEGLPSRPLNGRDRDG